MLRNAQDFISLVGSHDDEAIELIKKQPEMLISLFKNADEVIQLARTGYKPNPDVDLVYDGVGGERTYELISKQSAAIARLFKNSEQVIQLGNANTSPALALINLQSKTIADLFNSAAKFIQLASETDLNLACSLIHKQPAIILSLFKNKSDIQKLTEANSQVADVLVTTAKYSPNVGGLLKDLFLSSAANYVASIRENTSEANLKFNKFL